ncbi:LOW QUALITY PROTEIN: cytochrome P450 4B1-like [Sceloporus undulatus]|uniref:LOW QUALITY PROTEIN: cytochrome P450 4B1-like n=1 Tax=Sceloporus undulatus TaxID=8520 RepID=UPI001C4CC2D7|nr:LOW QUALITY PROTEIN: cytochrome P450 4B1-like [Sceloporus undulatus]
MPSMLETMAGVPSPQFLYLFIGFFFICGLLKVLQLFWRKKQLLSTFKHFPGPPSHWFFGNNKMVIQGNELNKILEWAGKYPYAYPRWFSGFAAILIVNHPDYAKTIFGRADPKSMIPYHFFIPWIGKGLLVLDGPKWFQHRRLLTPGFHYDILKPYIAQIADSTKVMLDKWEKLIAKDNRTSVEIVEYVSLMTLDSIMKCVFTSQSSNQTCKELDHYIKAVYDLTYLVAQRIRNILYRNDIIYPFTSAGRHFMKACRLAHKYTENVIEERKKSFREEGELKKIQNRRYLDFLDILLSAKDENGVGLSKEDLRAEVDTFMFEGHDTTASGISWLLYAMAQNPEHQQRCREEIKETLGDRDTVQWDDLGKMPYITMCIKESLRLYPPVPGVSRQLNKPVTFCDGRTLPEGATVFISIYCIHRNPSIWEDPEVFDPTRFSPEKSSHRHPHAFVPFAAGARNCIGQQFAMNEMKVALAQILLQFEVLPDPTKPPIPVPQIVLKSENGIHLFLKKLN